METEEPSPSMLRLMVPILPEHIWKDIDGDAVATFANDKTPVGSGPFRLVEAQTGQFYRFAANKSYWAGAPKIDELVLRIFADDEAMAQALQATARSTWSRTSRRRSSTSLKNEPGITTSSSKYSGFNELAYNLGAATADGKAIGDGHPALQDKRVRIAHRPRDRPQDAGGARCCGNHGTAATGVIPPIYAGRRTGTRAAPSAAFDLGQGQLDPRRGRLRRRAPTASGPGRTGASSSSASSAARSRSSPSSSVEYIRDWLKEIGITAIVSIMSEDQLTAVIGKGEYDMFEWGWVVEPDPDFQLSVFTCDQRSYEDGGEIAAGWSDSFYCNPAYDALYDAAEDDPRPGGRGPRSSSRRSRCSTTTRSYSMLYYYNNLEAYRSDRFTEPRAPADRRRLARVPVRHLHLPQHRRRSAEQTQRVRRRQPRPVARVSRAAPSCSSARRSA